MEHPITPPSELILQWWDDTHGAFYEFEAITIKAARWGADQELEACVEHLKRIWSPSDTIDSLCTARRPKSPSLREQALEALNKIEDNKATYLESSIIRRALEQLND